MEFSSTELTLTTNTTHDNTIFSVDDFLNGCLDRYDYINLNNLLSVKYWYTGTTNHRVDRDDFSILISDGIEYIKAIILNDDDTLTRVNAKVSDLKSKKIPTVRGQNIKWLTPDILGIDEHTKKVVLLLMDRNNSVRGSTPYCKFHLIQFTEKED